MEEKKCAWVILSRIPTVIIGWAKGGSYCDLIDAGR